MKPNTATKSRDFLDEVVDEMPEDGDDEYGAEMEDEEGSGEEAREDGIMATKQFLKAAGINADAEKVYEPLKALIKTCM